MKRTEQRRNARGGFTLIEVLLVVAILGILATVVVVNIGGRREEAMIGAARTSIQGIAQAANLYEVDTGRYPSSIDGLIRDDGSLNWRGPYFRGGMPVDPWGTAYTLTPKGDRDFVVRSAGPDRQMGTDDDLSSFTDEG